MKTVSRMLMLLVLGVVLVTPLSGLAQKSQTGRENAYRLCKRQPLWLKAHGRHG